MFLLVSTWIESFWELGGSHQPRVESLKSETKQQLPVPAGGGGGQGPDPLLKCCDEQMCGLRNEYEPGTDSARGQPVIKFIWFVTIITFVCRVHPKFAQPRQCHLSSYSGGRTLHCIAKMCYWLKFSFRTLFSYSLSLCNVMHSYQKFLKFASGIFERGREKWLVLASWGWAACNKFDAWYR